MAKKATTDKSADPGKLVQLVVDLSEGDTVYADVYLRRARELLASALPLEQYHALKGIERDIEETVRQSKASAASQDWQRVAALAGQVDVLRHRAHEKAALMTLGAAVYDPVGVSIDPFSPGFDFLAGRDQDLAGLRDALVDKLDKLAGLDPPLAAFYTSRRAFLAGLGLLSKRAGAKTAAVTGRAELERLAAQAAQQGDMAQLQRYAQELLAHQTKTESPGAAESATATPAAERETYQCPVDLAVPFSDEVRQRASALGLAAARTEPLPQAAPLLDYVIPRAWQPSLPGAETERDGTMRADAVVEELGLPKEVAEPVKVMVAQFLRTPFINSGGARYLPLFTTEEVLIEDFPETAEPPATGELLAALGLGRRRALARFEIDDALHEHGAAILEDRLGLDPREFRLVCIPHDLYMRVGRDRGWGQQQQWTHFDGYQVRKNGALRALVGGDVRYGGLNDLLSIAITDQRECVVARFAVIRRARQVARWR
jgi:hypothetical protein